MLLALSSLVVQGPRTAEQIRPLIEGAELAACFEAPVAFELELIVPGKLDGVHLDPIEALDDTTNACLDEKLQAVAFPKLDSHQKSRVVATLEVTAPEQPVSEEPVDRP